MRVDLTRFEQHHDDATRAALYELRAGRRIDQWAPCLLPRIGADGCGLHSIEEAEAYLLEGPLFRDYGALLEAVRERVVEHRASLDEVLGTPAAVELVSSLTLVRGVSRRLVGNGFAQMVETCDELLGLLSTQGHQPCPATLQFLAKT